MGTIFKRGKTWGINYTDPSGRQKRELISPYKETAEKVLKKIETEIVEGKYFDIHKAKSILFEDFAKLYIDNYVKLENRNLRNNHGLIKNLVDHFQGKTLDKIDNLAIRQFMAKRLEGVSPATVNRHYSQLKGMYNRAIEWGMFFGMNPTKGIKPLPENNERCRWLAIEEQIRLLSFCSGHTWLIVLIALQTGMRWGEIVNLKWRQSQLSHYVDFSIGKIIVHSSLAKTKKSRHIPMPKILRLALRDVPKSPDHDYVIVNPETKKPLNNIRKSFATALKKAGIDDFKFHDLRHTYASTLLRNGEPLHKIQRLLGHTTPTMTQRYAHLAASDLEQAIEKIDIQFDNLLYNSKFSNEMLEKVV
jgi:integrase